MTEDEAKKKWCPFARVPIMTETDGVAISGNRVQLRSGEEKIVRCIGSACMAWRQDTHIPLHPAMTENKKKELREGGHCGLAGKP